MKRTANRLARLASKARPGALALAALAASQPASAIWYYAPITSGKPGDAGMFGAAYVSVEGDRALISNGSLGAFSHLVSFTGSGMTYDREQVTSANTRGVAMLNGEAWLACGTELRRYSRLSLGAWVLQQSWDLNNTVYDVAADGNVVVCSYAVSAASGGIAIFEKVSGVWSKQYNVNASIDYFGEHVDVLDLPDVMTTGQRPTVYRNARLIVSGRGSDGAATNAGAAYIYRQASSSWSYEATLNAPAPVANDEFGAEVALSGAFAYVSNLGSGSSRGQVVAFKRGSGGWASVATISPVSATSDFGRSLDADSDRVVIGQSGTTYGQAFLFARSGSAWNWSTTFASRDPSSDPNFASAVSLDGSNALVGGGDNSAGQGVVYFFGDH